MVTSVKGHPLYGGSWVMLLDTGHQNVRKELLRRRNIDV